MHRSPVAKHAVKKEGWICGYIFQQSALRCKESYKKIPFHWRSPVWLSGMIWGWWPFGCVSLWSMQYWDINPLISLLWPGKEWLRYRGVKVAAGHLCTEMDVHLVLGRSSSWRAEPGPLVASADSLCPAGVVVKSLCNYNVHVSVVPFLYSSYFLPVGVNKPNVSVCKSGSAAVKDAFCTNCYN